MPFNKPNKPFLTLPFLPILTPLPHLPYPLMPLILTSAVFSSSRFIPTGNPSPSSLPSSLLLNNVIPPLTVNSKQPTLLFSTSGLSLKVVLSSSSLTTNR